MEKERNNLFKYATKELSQDAFICWCINWINYPNDKLYNLGTDFLKMILSDEKGNQRIEITEKTQVKILRQYEKIDILLVIDNKYLVIIEDKINSFNHNQVTNNISFNNKAYKYKLINLLDEKVRVNKDGKFYNDGQKNTDKIHKRWEEIGLKEFKVDNIIEVYVKSGIMTKLDNAIYATKIDTNKILNVLTKYIEDSEIVKDFYECLKFKIDLIDENRVNEIIDKGSIKVGTKFRYRAMFYNCFFKTTGKMFKQDFAGNMDLRLRAGGIDLDKNVSIWFPRLFKQNNWLNTLNEENNIIIEENLIKKIEEKNMPKYKYVFVRRIDEFSDKYFEFIGVYAFDKMENENKRILRKVNLGQEITLDIRKLIRM